MRDSLGRVHSLLITPPELALLGLAPGDALPPGGRGLDLELRSGSGTSYAWINLFGPIFVREGITFHPGSLNLFAPNELHLESPRKLTVDGQDGFFAPIILDESAVGVAFKHSGSEPNFVEVFSPIHLRSRLRGAADHSTVHVRLLPGTAMARGLTSA
jgi:hypothetical protein